MKSRRSITASTLGSLLCYGVLHGVCATPAAAHCGCEHDFTAAASGSLTVGSSSITQGEAHFFIEPPVPLPSGIRRSEVENNPSFPSYLSYATEVMDNLMTYGTDRYGSVQSQLLVSNLDVRTKDNPLAADLALADTNVRVFRKGRRAPGGSNFFHNQWIYRAMNRASQVTGDSTYADFVEANIDWALTNLVNIDGTLHWGWHRSYDVHTDVKWGHQGSIDYVSEAASVHEVHGMDAPLWEQMWQNNPAVIENAMEQMWIGHLIDKTTGAINRHNDALVEPNGNGRFVTSYSALIESFAFMATKVPGTIPGTPAGEPTTWMGRAKLLEQFNWDGRNTTTNLMPDMAQFPSDWIGVLTSTTLPGVYVPGLLRSYEYTGDTYFRDRALTYLDAWGTYAYDASTDNIWGVLELDGTPRPGPMVALEDADCVAGGFGCMYEPRGYVDMWAPVTDGTQNAFSDAAQFIAKAYEMFGATGSLTTPLLTTAERWASTIRKNMPITEVTDDINAWYRAYSKEWDEKRGMYKDEPFHNWASHGADMSRYAALSEKKMINESQISNRPFYDNTDRIWRNE